MAKITEQQLREMTRKQPMTAALQLGLLRAAVHEYLNAHAAYNNARQVGDPSPVVCARVKSAESELQKHLQER